MNSGSAARHQHDRARDLVGLAVAADRHVAEAVLVERRVLRGPLRVVFRHDRAGADRVHDDVVFRELVGHRAREVDHGGLWRARRAANPCARRGPSGSRRG